MKLYFSPGACSMAPHIVLEELGANYQVNRVDLRAHKLENGEDYSHTNPKNQVPALKTDKGDLLTENAIILQYVCDQHPEKHLLPKYGTWERYRANEWLNYIATEVHKSLGFLFGVDRLIPEPAANAEFRKNYTANLGRKFDYLSAHLKDHGFLLGSQFSAPDAYLFTLLNWHGMLKIDLKPYPVLMGYMEKVKSRPSVQKVMKAEGLI